MKKCLVVNTTLMRPRYGTHSQRISQFYIHTPCSSVAFPAEAGLHLPNLEGWKAELALDGWLVTERNVRQRELNPDMLTHPSTNCHTRAWRRLTSLIKTNMAPLCQTTTPLPSVVAVLLVAVVLHRHQHMTLTFESTTLKT